MRIYRVEVDAWPTETGYPWDRFYYGEAADVEWGIDDRVEDAPDWVLACATDPVVAHRFQYNLDGQLVGVLMPATVRRNYLSGTAARRLVEQMRAFGARVRLVVSEPVFFPDA